jgi:hypothetical protein
MQVCCFDWRYSANTQGRQFASQTGFPGLLSREISRLKEERDLTPNRIMTCDHEEVLDNKPRSEQNRHVQEVVNSAHEHLRELLQQRADMTRRIETVKRVLVGLSSIYGTKLSDDELHQLLGRNPGSRRRGLTDACRRILLQAREPMRAKGMCERILEEDRELLQHHKDPIASIVTVLNRLVAYGEARTVTTENQRGWVSAGE